MTWKKSLKSRIDGRISIPEFYAGKSVFITGATGFLGKVLVEKLLRSCPAIDKIYILMRAKKGKSFQERLDQMISLPLFVKVRRENESALKKIIPLSGDVIEKNLGLSEEDRKKLIQEVSVVFHVAACVRFDDPLKQALLLNTRGTLEVVLLAKQMKNLESFVHVSTTYCNTHREVIEESLYPAPGDWRTLVHLAESLDQETLETFAPKILVGFPNTYTFTKALAEHVVKDFEDFLPAIIFRPSIVISSLLEPLPGWIDNFNGPIGLLVASGKGIVHTVYSDPKIRADYVPVDAAVKSMVVTAWDRATSRDTNMQVRVYNCSSYGIQSITQTELVNMASFVSHIVPLDDILWYPRGNVTAFKLVYYFKVLIFHILPAILVDFALKMAGKKPMLLKLQRKIFVANMALTYFLTKQWSFKNDKLFEVEKNMLEEDKPNFSYKVENLDVLEYFKNCAYGVREFLLKEDNTNLPEAKKHFQKMYFIDRAMNLAFIIVCVYLIYKLQFLPFLRGYIKLFIGLLAKIFF